ncbi:Uncharacterized protein Y057_13779 [Fusarium fujikuroi]|nr:Uncharacterized protein Y057_13779 [Fusarium fujikuroi]
MASPFPEAKIDKAAREAEYQALWQVCDRATRKPEYIYGDERLKRSFLEDTCDALMRKSPMPYAGNSPAFNPPQSVYAANPDPFNGNPGPYNGNPAPYNIAQAPLPIPQPRARASPPDFDFAIPDTNEDLRQDMERVINTLRQYAQRIATLEKTVAKITREREMYKAGTIDMMNTDMKKSASVSPGLFNYPVEGIEGLSAAAYPHPGPLTPRSQTQGGDEEGDGMYQHGN